MNNVSSFKHNNFARIASIVLVALLVLSLSIPVFAAGYFVYTIPSTNSNDALDRYNVGFKVGANASSYIYSFVTYNTNDEFAVVAVKRDSTRYYIYVLSKAANTTRDKVLVYRSNDNGTTASNSGMSGGPMTLDINTNVYYLQYIDNITNINSQVSQIMGVYDTLAEALAAYAEGEPEPETGNALNIALPAGNVIFIDIANTGSNQYRLETTGGTTGAVVNPGMNSIQMDFINSLPNSITTPVTGASYPSWTGYGNQSILGTYNRQESTGDIVLANTNNHRYLMITNPMYPNDNNASGNRLNPDLNIYIQKANDYVIYSLLTGYQNGSLIGNGEQYSSGHFDEDIGEWVEVDNNGNPTSPVWGGQNDFQNTPTTIFDWLENIANQISGFLQGAIGAVTVISQAVANFVSIIKALYVWLPAPVYSLLSSAIMLAITIGVIKVFI